MKKSLTIFLIFLATQAAINPVRSQDAYGNDQQDISYQTFYDDLSPYGQWINYPEYGYVWSPNVEYGFKPYATNGHWVYSDMGWTWVSDYAWGWAAFHYGRWFYDNQYGWLWLPGTEWAPAWVSWRTSSDYYGWAPLSPNISFSISIGSYNPPYNYWCFVPHQYICDPYANRYYIHESRNLAIINNTTIINNSYYFNRGGNRYGNSYSRTFFASGPNRVEVERFTRNTIRPVVIRDNSRPGNMQISNNQLSIFRPNVNTGSRSSDSRQRFAPARTEPHRGSARVGENNNSGFRQQTTNAGNGLNNNRGNNLERRRFESPDNSGRGNNPPAIQRNDNRAPSFNRRSEPVNNQVDRSNSSDRRNFFNNNNRNMQPAAQQQRTVSQPVFNNSRASIQSRVFGNGPANNSNSNNRRSFTGDNNRGVQPARQQMQTENRPAFNNNRTAMQSPAFRNNPVANAGGSRFQQDRGSIGRTSNQSSQNPNRTSSQQPNRNGEDGRDVRRRGR